MSEAALYTVPCPFGGCVGLITVSIKEGLKPGSKFACNVCGKRIVSGGYDHDYAPGDPAVVAKPKDQPS